MNLKDYFFALNRNNSFKLDQDEMKDLIQKVDIYLMEKDYNDELKRKTALVYYRREVSKKIQREEFIKSEQYNAIHDPGDHEKEIERLEKIGSLSLASAKQKKIVELLIRGYSYTEIRQKLGMSKAKLYKYIQRIKDANTPQGPRKLVTA